MKETVFDILRTLNIEKNVFTQDEWVELINELEVYHWLQVEEE